MDRSQTIESAEQDMEATTAPEQQAKARSCLRCETRFMSAWSGERICPRCKGSSAWRNDSPIHKKPAPRGR